MAHGIGCKHCGWEESDHQGGITEEIYHVAIRRLPSRRYSLLVTPRCPGFAYSKKEERRKKKRKIAKKGKMRTTKYR